VIGEPDGPRAIVGRDHERAAVVGTLDDGGPLVIFVHGTGGIGKSTLLRALAHDARVRGAAVVRLDCEAFEPTGQGFVDALNASLGAPVHTAAEAAAAVAALGDIVLLIVDAYEVFRISDSWLRSLFVPMLDDRVRIVIASREPPVSAWFAARGASERFRSMRLGPLDEVGAHELLSRAGVGRIDARVINRIARGHPLFLEIGAVALRETPELPVEEVAIPRIVDQLTQLYLDRLDARTRRLLDAAGVVRRVTASLLEAMLPDVDVDEGLERLASLPFVEEGADGLRLHETVQSAIAARLRSRDPQRHRDYRAAAWRSLRASVGKASRSELWRYTADMLFLLENPDVREAFFPTTAHLYAVEPARAEDEAAIVEMVVAHEPEESVAALHAWWEARPEAFRVARDRSGVVAGFTTLIDAASLPYNLARADPVVVAWRQHLSSHPLPGSQRALFQRWELSRDHGEEPSPVQAALWLDIKRAYMEMRPHLGRLYSVVTDPAPYADALATLGFSISRVPIRVGHEVTPIWLDFGPESVDGWLTRLAAAELGIVPEKLLDPDNRELVLDGRRVPLSPLEFGVFDCLSAHPGSAVSRATLIEEVWGHKYLGGSNVVDVVIRSLRRKLGDGGPTIETVRGLGYRLKT